MRKNNWSIIFLILFLISIILAVIFKDNQALVWCFSCICVISTFLFAYTRAKFQNEDDTKLQAKIIKQITLNRYNSGIDEIIFELYTSRIDVKFLKPYKSYISSINFMTADINKIEFDINITNFPTTIYIRYDEDTIRIDDLNDVTCEEINVVGKSKDEIIDFILKNLKVLDTVE